MVHLIALYICRFHNAPVSVTVKMYIEDIQKACRRVLKGDKKAEEELGLDTIEYDRPTPHNLSVRSLQATYNSVLTTAVAARELDLPFFEKQCQLTMQLLQAIAEAKKVEFEHNIDAQDVAEVMLALIHDKAGRHNYKEVPEEEDRDDESSTTTSPAAAAAEQPTQTPVAATSIDQEQPSKGKDADAQQTPTPAAATSSEQEQPSKAKDANAQPAPTPAAATSSEQARPSKTKDVHKQPTLTPAASTPPTRSQHQDADVQPTPTPAAATSSEQAWPSKTKDANEQATPTSPARGKCTAKDSYSSSTSKTRDASARCAPSLGRTSKDT